MLFALLSIIFKGGALCLTSSVSYEYDDELAAGGPSCVSYFSSSVYYSNSASYFYSQSVSGSAQPSNRHFFTVDGCFFRFCELTCHVVWDLFYVL